LSFFGFKGDTPASGVTYPASRISVVMSPGCKLRNTVMPPSTTVRSGLT
jgi:hypothetical protein